MGDESKRGGAGLAFRGTARFEIVRQLGAGGMGVVYEAFDRKRCMPVALKTLRAINPEGVRRFKTEFRTLQGVTHPNLVTLGEFFAENETWFFTMELLDGVTFLDHVWARWPAAGAARDPTTTAVERSSAAAPRAEAKADPTQLRERPPVDERLLRGSLVQLTHGLLELHRIGIVHRDVKPSNVIITREGRTVLLDFGLVARTEPESEVSKMVRGTVPYMAPEQAASRPVGPAADWYSVGAMLYEALTGSPPFQGPPLVVLMEKQRAEPPPPHGRAPAALRDLCDLASELLRLDPDARPTGPAVLDRLGMGRAVAPPARPAAPPSPLVGREEELQSLSRAFEDVPRGQAVAVLVQGESGVGKSALVRHFADVLRLRAQAPVVLAGRCYERETVPYKAFDGIVDALLKTFKRMPAAEVSAFMPRNPGLLAQAFPALRAVPDLALAPQRTQPGPDPLEQRNRVFAAFREMLGRVADRTGLVLVLDDLQWADADSFALLAEILRPPDAPPLLLVATARPELSELLSRMAPGRAGGDLRRILPGDVRTLSLGVLPRAAARELARSLIGPVGPGPGMDPDRIALEAGGHPLFIDELVRHGAVHGSSAATASLAEALWARVKELDPFLRRLVQMVAIAGAPLRQDVAAQAMAEHGVPPPPQVFEKAVGYLRAANLVRTGGLREVDTIEPYHDRVRESVSGRLDTPVRKELHEQLARALSVLTSADPERLAIHWREAGDRERAGAYAAAAAAQAAEAFAFARAARLYWLAIELRPGAPDNGALWEQLGHSLANAGRGPEAADAFLQATALADPARALELRWRAASQLMLSGHLDRGLATLATVLDQVGMHLPRTPARALLSLLYNRALLRLRGLGFQERDPSQISARDLVRVDVSWSVSVGLGMVDTIRGSDFQTRSVRLALRAGEPSRIARALAVEAAYTATVGPPSARRTAKLLSIAQDLAARLGSSQSIGMVTGMSGIAAFLEARWADSLERCDRATAELREGSTGVTWEVDTFGAFALWDLTYLGDFKALSRRLPVLIRDALDRGDIYAATNIRSGHANVLWLARDEVEAALGECDEAMRTWSRTGFHLQHFYDLLARCQADLYVSRGRDALARVEESWASLERSMLLRIHVPRVFCLYLRGRALIATEAGGHPDRERLLAAAERDARRLQRESTPWARSWSLLLQAGIARRRRQDDTALALLAQAQKACGAAGTTLHATAAKRWWGEMVGGDIGREAVREADELMASQTIQNPRKLSGMMVVGFAG